MTFTLTWIDAAGASTALTQANGLIVTRGAIGLGAPAPQNVLDSYISSDGATLVNRRRDAQQVVLPLLIQHASNAQVLVRQVARMFQGPGQLTYSDGTNTRTLRNVIYNVGLGGDTSAQPSRLWRRVNVGLLALDPWWYGPSVSQSLTAGTTTAWDAAVTFNAAIPWDGGGSTSVVVDGDADVSPVVTITGPATTLTTTQGGIGWALATPLIAGDILVVDSRPGSRGPRLNGGTTNWALLTQASRLWTLSPGTQSVFAGATGTTGATTISVAWEPRWLTP